MNENEIKWKQLNHEYEKVQLNLNNVVQERDGLKKQLGNFQASISNYEGEVNRRITGYE